MKTRRGHGNGKIGRRDVHMNKQRRTTVVFPPTPHMAEPLPMDVRAVQCSAHDPGRHEDVRTYAEHAGRHMHAIWGLLRALSCDIIIVEILRQIKIEH